MRILTYKDLYTFYIVFVKRKYNSLRCGMHNAKLVWLIKPCWDFQAFLEVLKALKNIGQGGPLLRDSRFNARRNPWKKGRAFSPTEHAPRV